jgi:hypothetical protein
MKSFGGDDASYENTGLLASVSREEAELTEVQVGHVSGKNLHTAAFWISSLRLSEAIFRRFR